MGTVELLTNITESLRTLLPEQRWFAGKGLPVHQVIPVHATVLGGTDPRLVHAVVEIDQGQPRRDRYQLLLGVRHELPESLGHAWVGSSGDQVVYQAMHDPELTAILLELMARNTEVGGVRLVTEPGVVLDAEVRSRPVGAEQSNTSLVYGQSYILKLFRKLGIGASPDLELHRALATVGCKHIAALLGSIEGELDGAAVTYGMLNEYLRNSADGWAMATASVRDLLATDLLSDWTPGSAEQPQPHPHPHPENVGGDFASEAHRLGHAVATVHSDLAAALGSSPAPAGYFDTLADNMHRRLDSTLAQVPELAPYEPALRVAFDAARRASGPVPAQRGPGTGPGTGAIQRIHGDLHLGQVLRSVTGWVLIDFEGEPMVPLAERVAPASPLRDVAGMLRSFDYAAHHVTLGDTDSAQRAAVLRAWAMRNQEAFCDGYAQVAPDPREQGVLLRAFELDKAVYEVSYEHHNRPPWLPIPLAAIARLVEV